MDGDGRNLILTVAAILVLIGIVGLLSREVWGC